MDVFAVQTYFSTKFLAFFETLLQIRRPVLVGNDLVEEVSVDPSNPTSRRPLRGEAASGACVGGVCSVDSTLPPAGQFDMLRVASSKFHGDRYDKLALELIPRGAMPLGLYRPAKTKGSSLPYTQVNPDVTELVVEGDFVFVLRSGSCKLFGSI